MKNKNSVFIAVIFALSNGALAQGIHSYGDYVGLVNDRLRSSATIEAYDSTLRGPRGTASIILYRGYHFFITNNHILRAFGKDERPLIGYNTNRGKVYYGAKEVVNWPERDISILIRTGELINPNKVPEGIEAEQAGIGVSVFADSSHFRAGTEVLIVGYPLGLGVNISSNTPVARRGIVALRPTADGFYLVDGNVSRGNSGSPVYSVPEGKFMGLVIGFHNETIPAFDERGAQIVSLPYNSGITLCVSSFEIRKLLDSIK